MRVSELVEDGRPGKLIHPIVGKVDWKEIGPGSGYMLYFADGPEKDKPLSVDSVVLFDTRWKRILQLKNI